MLKKIIYTLSILILLSISTKAQIVSHTAFRYRQGTTLPSSCSPSDVFFQTSDNKFYGCTASNTWTIFTSGAGGGTVTTVSVVTANGVSGSVANPTTTPAITLTLGAITPSSISTSGFIATGVGGSVAGTLELVQGTAPSAGTTSVKIYAPASVTSYILKLPAAAATGIGHFSNSAGVVTESWSAVVEADITLAANTTNNVTTSAHGFAPILPNDATKYLDGTGAYTVPASGGGLPSGLTFASPDFTVATAAANQAVLSGSTTTNPVKLTATGSDSNIQISLVPKGAKDVAVTGGVFAANNGNAASSVAFGFTSAPTTGIYTNGSTDVFFHWLGTQIAAYGVASTIQRFSFSQPTVVGWSTSGAGGANQDTSFARNAAGLIEINNGTTGTFRDLIARNIKLGATTARGTTEGTNTLSLFNGTAPVGILTNGGSIYSSGGELFVIDAGGTATQISPHDRDGNWVFNSTNTTTGKKLKIDVEKLLRFLNSYFGTDFIHEYIEVK